MDVTGTALGTAAGANQEDGLNYGATVTGDPSVQSDIANDYANGKAIANTAYSNTKTLDQATASFSGFVNGFSVVTSPNATAGQKTLAIGMIAAAVAGSTYLVAEGAGVLVTYGLLTTAEVATASIPLVGAVIGVALVVVAAVLAALPWASGAQPTWTSQDQANAVLLQTYKLVGMQPLAGAPFTDRSRQVASYLASYVMSQVAASNHNASRAVTNSANTKGFEYMAADGGTMHNAIASLYANDKSKADQAISIVQVLWDPRWQASDSYAGDPSDYLLGYPEEIDSATGNAYPVGSWASLPGVPADVHSVTDLKGLTTATYLCELAAAAIDANLSNPAGAVYTLIYLRLCALAWVWLDSGQDVPACLNAAIGFMLSAAAQNNVLVLANQNVSNTLALRPAGITSMALDVKSLDYWVNYYLHLGGVS